MPTPARYVILLSILGPAACALRGPSPTGCLVSPATLTAGLGQPTAVRPRLVWSDGKLSAPDSVVAEISPGVEWSGPVGPAADPTWYLTVRRPGSLSLRLQCFLGDVAIAVAQSSSPSLLRPAVPHRSSRGSTLLRMPRRSGRASPSSSR